MYWPVVLIGLVVLAALALFVVERLQPALSVAAPTPMATATAVATLAAPTAAVATEPPTAAVAQQVELPLAPISMDQLLKGLFRQGVRPEGPLPTVDVLLSAPIYFAATGRQAPADALQAPSILFHVTEDSHEELPIDPPAPMLVIDGQEMGGPVKTTVLADSYHHRTSLLRYTAVDGAGQPLVTAATKEVQLVFPAPGGWSEPANTLIWELPIAYLPDFSSWQIALGMAAAAPVASQLDITDAPVDHSAHTSQGAAPTAVQSAQVVDEGARVAAAVVQPVTWAAILAIMAGMLTALSPCLIQLVLYFTATLAAVSNEEKGPGVAGITGARRHVMLTGLFFAGGFTLVYTAGGAAAGYIGQSMDRVGILTTWARPLSIAAGAIILLMALRVAWNARAPLVCRLPMTPIFGRERRTGVIGSAVMGISFATGCLACFSATILPALLLYAGSTGSVAYGTALLLVFSLGITIPCLVLTFGISRLQPLVARIQGAGPYLGLASALVMASFGVIMLTDQFHLVSSLIFQYLNLG
ncbi:MAG: sulfite exporter TauE/SafE family protein [Caldilineaceae bacterium]|nr:sulfite exporter TauE/SafE family protein [Caldilineaceae bacterium]